MFSSVIIVFLFCGLLGTTPLLASPSFLIIQDSISLEDDWFYYPSCSNYAPCGMPDFDQKQDNWKDPVYNGWTFCGALSVANILWYIDSFYADSMGHPGDGQDMFPVVLDYHAQSEPHPGPHIDDHNSNNVNDVLSPWDQEESLFGNELIERVAWYVDTNGCRTDGRIWGTPLNSMELGVRKWFEDAGVTPFFEIAIETAYPRGVYGDDLWLDTSPIQTKLRFDNTQGNLLGENDIDSLQQRVTIDEDFTFQSICSRITNGSFIILGVNGYDSDKTLYFSHWVTVAGIHPSQSQIALSDPYFDTINHTNDFTLHNDAAVVSHDIYTVNTTSPYPDAPDLWWLEGYLPDLYAVVLAAFIITPITDSIPQLPPVAFFIKPDEGYVLHNGKHIMPTLFGKTVLLGETMIEANAFSKEGIKGIEFYLNDELMYVDDAFPFEWQWSDSSFGKYTLRIIASDTVGNQAEKGMTVWKFF